MSAFAWNVIPTEFANDFDFVWGVISLDGAHLRMASDELRDNKNIVLTAVSNCGEALSAASTRLQDDHEVVLAAVRDDGSSLQYASARLKDREDIVAHVGINSNIDHMSARLRQDKAFTMATLTAVRKPYEWNRDFSEFKDDIDVMMAVIQRYGGDTIACASARLRRNKNLALKTASIYGKSIMYVSLELQDDDEVVRMALRECFDSVSYISPRLMRDKKMLLEVIKSSHVAKPSRTRDVEKSSSYNRYGVYIDHRCVAIRALPDCIKLDDEIILALVIHLDYPLELASQSIRSNKTVMLDVLAKRGNNLKYVSDELKNDKAVVSAAVNNSGFAIRFASLKMRADRTLGMIAVSTSRSALADLSEELKNDVGIVFEAVTKSGTPLLYASSERRADADVVAASIIKYSNNAQYASEKLMNNRDFIIRCVSQSGPNILVFLSSAIRADRNVIMTAVSCRGYALRYASDDLRADREVVLTSVSITGATLQYASEELKSDIDVVLAAVNSDGMALAFASIKLKNRLDITLIAVTQNMNAFQYISVRDIATNIRLMRVATAAHPDTVASRYRSKGLATEYAQFIQGLKLSGRALYTRRLLRNFSTSPGRRPISYYMLNHVFAYMGMPSTDILHEVEAAIQSYTKTPSLEIYYDDDAIIVDGEDEGEYGDEDDDDFTGDVGDN